MQRYQKLPPLGEAQGTPNIMFTLDDSGSILFKIICRWFGPQVFNYVAAFPVQCVQKTGDFFQSVVGFGDGYGTDNGTTLKSPGSGEVNGIYLAPILNMNRGRRLMVAPISTNSCDGRLFLTNRAYWRCFGGNDRF